MGPPSCHVGSHFSCQVGPSDQIIDHTKLQVQVSKINYYNTKLVAVDSTLYKLGLVPTFTLYS